ncbi:unnamed protein product [Spodoptera exigua]|nr:unnamed protein product [Spodoptera exigua]
MPRKSYKEPTLVLSISTVTYIMLHACNLLPET